MIELLALDSASLLNKSDQPISPKDKANNQKYQNFKN